MKSIGAMVKQLAGMVGTDDLTKWEQDFVSSVGRRTGDGEHTTGLSYREVEKVEQIYSKHFGDAA